ncbi:MAG: hypothetical protein AAB359_03120 [Elusimicrobiota bacterium]
MKKATVMLAMIFAVGVNLGRAGEMEKRDFPPDISDLQKSGININMNGDNAGIPLPGRPGNGPGHHPPVPYPNSGYRRFSFNSGGFALGSEAEKSMNNAVAALQLAGYPILEKHRSFNVYTLVFLAPDYARLEQYKSGTYNSPGDARKAADEAVAAFESQGMVVLEKRMEWASFTVGYLTNPYAGQIKNFRFNSGGFTFRSEADKSMNNAVAALQVAGYPVLEKHRGINAYTLVFLAPGDARIEQYKSGTYPFSNDAKKAADEVVASLESQGMVVLEKRVDRTSFTISYLSPV